MKRKVTFRLFREKIDDLENIYLKIIVYIARKFLMKNIFIIDNNLYLNIYVNNDKKYSFDSFFKWSLLRKYFLSHPFLRNKQSLINLFSTYMCGCTRVQRRTEILRLVEAK